VIYITIIVGVVDRSSSTPRVLMGADSGASDESIILAVKDRKIIRNGKYLIGYAGDPGLGQLLHSIELPDPTNVRQENLLKFMRLNFAKTFKDAVDFYSPHPTAGDKDDEGGVAALIGIKGRLFEFDSGDYQINEFDECAIGSGSHFAFGVLYATAGYKDQKKRIIKSLQCSIKYSPSCLDPIYIETI
jgi:ATP-dependent protease HslVU (ClpYQ) peptidase subunit